MRRTMDGGKAVILTLLAFFLLGPLAAACGPLATAPGKKELVEVQVGDLGFLDDMHFYLAFEKGYFAEQGIKPNFQRFRSAVDMIAPLSKGDLQVGAGGVSVGLFNALARGAPIKAVASRSILYVPFDSNWWMVRSDLADKIKKPADLKGRKVNMQAPGSAVYYPMGVLLQQGGLTFKDIDVEHVGQPDAVVAIEKKAIDISIGIEPFPVIMVEKGIAQKWASTTQFTGPTQVAIIMYNEDWAKKNPDLAKGFMVAYLKGLRDYYTAMLGGANRKEVVELATKYTAMKDPAQYDKIVWTGTKPNGYIDVANVKAQQEWYSKNGFLETKADIDKLVDHTYVDFAVGKLGKLPE